MKAERAISHKAEETALGLGWSAALERRTRGATLLLRHAEQGAIEVEITITARGPVIRASGLALEIEATDEIVARCRRFAVEASENISFRAAEISHEAVDTFRAEARAVEVEARAGGVRIHANDDVQLLGEQVLLNCERPSPMPSWLPTASPQEVTLPRQDRDGDERLIEEFAPK